MNRLRLSMKLALAIIPIGIVALLAAGFVAYTFLGDSEAQNETAHAAAVTADAIATLNALWTEEALVRDVVVFDNAIGDTELDSAREQVDEALSQLEESTAALQRASQGFFEGVAKSAAEDVDDIRAGLERMRSFTSPTPTDLLGYREIADSILSLLPKTSSIVSDRLQARELSTAYFLAEGGEVSLQQEQLIEEFRALEDAEGSGTASLQARSSLHQTLEVLEDEFGAWALRANQTANRMNAAILRYTMLPELDIETFPLARNENILTTSEQLANGVAEESAINATESESEALLVAGITAAVLLVALLGAYTVIRSVVRRVRGVTDAAVEVAEVDLPNLVDALQNPKEDITSLKPIEIASAGHDEVGDLAKSFTLLHSTLIDVAGQQMDILRKGVSDIFVTLARRNRSLVDRQLALLDELESTEEDPGALGGYYKLDHLATRMRRNAESLLVLAGTEPTRIWSKPLEISEIIRAALGEVDEYQRVDIMALEPALVSGRAVADIAHLTAELLDNGTQYSSPADRVRVAGLFDPEGYMLTVSDTGIGMSEARMHNLNELLESPPVLGLALEPTLGMYVVASLASRHGIDVQLISGAPGLTVKVLLPKELVDAVKPKDDDQPPVRHDRPTFVAGSDQRRALNGATAMTPQNDVAPLSASDGTPRDNGRGTVIDATEDEKRPSVLPGSVKGKHEHPGRPGSLMPSPDEIEEEPITFEEITRSETAARPFSDQEGDTDDTDESPLGLARRIPGESVGADERSGDDVEWAVADISNDRPPAPETPKEEPWWVAAEGHDDEEAKPAAKASPFEFWDSDFEQPEAETEPAESPPPPALSGAGLPVRTPGTSFKETEDLGASAAASASGAMGIRSALASFEGGRELAFGEKARSGEDENEDSGESHQ